MRTASGGCEHILILKCIVYNLFHYHFARFKFFEFESICWPLVVGKSERDMHPIQVDEELKK